jgi:hypothetical protein
LLAPVLLVAMAAPAAADPARPTNARSEVLSVTPAQSAVRVDVVGGDAFLRLRVDRGHVVIVQGYEKEPYLRFNADGTIDENHRSPAVYLNKSRYSGAARPTDADAKATPAWVHLASGGEYTWHDHRIHFMGPHQPKGTSGWDVAISVDNVPVVVHGQFSSVTAPTSTPWWALTVVLFVAVAVFARRLRDRMIVVAAAIAPALWVTLAQAGVLPSQAGGTRPSLATAAIAVGLLVVGLALRSAQRSMVAGAGGALAVWGFIRRDVLNHAVLLSGLPTWVERLAVSAALGVGVAVLVSVAAELAGFSIPTLPRRGQVSPSHAGQ